MTKPKIPDPVAIYKPEYGICWTSSGMAVEAVDGIQFITTTQAEAYADAVRREALEEAAQEVELCYSNNDSQDDFQHRSAAAIRALIPHNENEQGNY